MERKKKPVNYVDNKKFYQAIVDYHKLAKEHREVGKEEPRIPDYIGECIYKIATRLSTKPCYMNYSFRDEMIADGVENCILYFRRFDPEKGNNPFAYFTQCINNAFLKRIEQESIKRYATYAKMHHMIVSNNSELFMDADDRHLLPTKIYDNITDFMEKFERKQEEKKLKRKQMKETNKNGQQAATEESSLSGATTDRPTLES